MNDRMKDVYILAKTINTEFANSNQGDVIVPMNDWVRLYKAICLLGLTETLSTNVKPQMIEEVVSENLELYNRYIASKFLDIEAEDKLVVCIMIKSKGKSDPRSARSALKNYAKS